MDDERINSEPVTTQPDALGKMLSDPVFLQKLSGILNGLQGASISTSEGGAENPVPPSEGTTPRSPEDTVAAAAPMYDGLAAVLSNPAMMEKLPAVIAMLKPMMENAGGTPASASASTVISSPEHSRETLLVALKPFLSKERGDAIDTILRISQLGSVLGQMK